MNADVSVRIPALPYLARWPAGVWLWAASLLIGLGIWPDLGSLMVGIFVILAALWFHRFREIEEPMQRLTQKQFFYRNVIAVGASLMMLGLFVAVGDGLRFAVTGPLFDF